MSSVLRKKKLLIASALALLILIVIFWFALKPVSEPGLERFVYGSNGKLISKKMPDGSKISFIYNKNGQASEIKYKNNRVQYSYDKSGNKIRMKDNSGVTEYYYNAFNMPVAVAWKHSPERLILYDYDSLGRVKYLAIINLDNIRNEPKYNDIIQQIDNIGSIDRTPANWHKYESSAQKLIEKIRHDTGALKKEWLEYSVSYNYDLTGNITSIKTPTGNITYHYFPEKYQVIRRLPNGIKSTFTYSTPGMLKSISHKTSAGKLIADYSYKYNAAGNIIKSIEKTPDGSRITEYKWGKRGYLQEIILPEIGKIEYKYDPMGNRIQEKLPSKTIKYHYDKYGKLFRAGSDRFEWNANGNLESCSGRDLKAKIRYNSMNLPSRIIIPGSEIKFKWDGNGRLISKTNKRETTHYIPNPIAPPGFTLAKYDKNHKPVSTYIYGDVLLGEINEKGEPFYYLEDGFNSIRYITNKNAHVAGSRNYTPFAKPVGGDGNIIPDFRCAGERYIPEIKTYLIGSRLYEPKTARYLSPSQNTGYLERFDSANRYAHACSNPGNFMSPRCNQTHKSQSSTNTLNLKNFSNNNFLDEEGRINPEFLRVFPGEYAPFHYEYVNRADSWRFLEQSPPMPSLPAENQIEGAFGLFPLFVSTMRWANSLTNDPQAKLYNALNKYARKTINSWIDHGRYPKGVVYVTATKNINGDITITPYSREGIRSSHSKSAPIKIYIGWRFPSEYKDSNRGTNTEIRAYHPGGIFVDSDDDRKKIPPPHDGGGPPGPPGVPGGGLTGIGMGDIGGGTGDPFKTTEKKLGGIKLAAEGKFVGNIGKITGAVYDPEKGCVVLLGDSNHSIPSVNAQDLAVAILCVEKGQDPQFSLDPADRKNPRGEWQRAVYIPENIIAGTEFGKALFEADWLLKQYAFGVRVSMDGATPEGEIVAPNEEGIPYIGGSNWSPIRKLVCNVPGFRNRTDLSFSGSNRNRRESWARFWIYSKEMKLKEGKNGIYFDTAKMGVDARKIVPDPTTRSGFRDVQATDPTATNFARIFTKKYDEIAKISPEFERVRQIAKAVAIAKWMKKRDIPLDHEWAVKTVNERVKTVDKVRSLSVEWVKRKRTVTPISGGKRISTSINRLHIFGGVDLTVKPKYKITPGIDKNLTEPVVKALKKNPKSLFNVEFHEKNHLGAVIPINKNGREILKNSRETKDGSKYQTDKKGNITSTTDIFGNKANYRYDSKNKLNGIDLTEKSGWKAMGKRSGKGSNWEIINPKGKIFGCELDMSGRIKELTADGKKIASYNYNPGGKQIDVKCGDYTEKIIKTGHKIIRMYEQISGKQEVSSRRKQMIKVEYDSSGNPVNMTGSNINPVYFKYLGKTNLPTEIKTGKWVVKCSYDSSKRPKKITFGKGDSIKCNYKNDMLDKIDINYNGKKAEMKFCKDGILEYKNFLGGVTKYKYEKGQLTSVDSDGFGEAEYKYDKKGRLTEKHFPGGGWIEYRYREKPNGELIVDRKIHPARSGRKRQRHGFLENNRILSFFNGLTRLFINPPNCRVSLSF